MRLQLHRHERSRRREVNRILRRCFVIGGTRSVHAFEGVWNTYSESTFRGIRRSSGSRVIYI
ncbi:hypothetical protein HanHA300_Chr06g0200921 [Helianthus annuus]|nr:hypothetical protein HanHA300_Chr06g0200921 [Helianthus annuus]